MSYDLIIVSQSNGDLIKVTQNCIDSARQDNADLNIIIIETGNPYKYDVDKILEYNGEFNYNRALNLGLKHAKSNIQILANNDIIFHKGWSKIGELMRLNDYLCASALSNTAIEKGFELKSIAYEGYEIGSIFTGWCVFTRKELWDQIHEIDERFPFWYADNAFAKQLQEKGIKHALICSVQVDHICSQTLVRQDRNKQRKYTSAQGYAMREFRK
jgi:hypothetical protein